MSQEVLAGQTVDGKIVAIMVDDAGVVQLASAVASAPGSAVGIATGNVAPVALTDPSPPAFVIAQGTLTLVTPGGVGLASLNVIYTDVLGNLRTRRLAGPLDVESFAGDDVSGVLPFQHSGATPIRYSITGITSPGAELSFAVAVH